MLESLAYTRIWELLECSGEGKKTGRHKAQAGIGIKMRQRRIGGKGSDRSQKRHFRGKSSKPPSKYCLGSVSTQRAGGGIEAS